MQTIKNVLGGFMLGTLIGLSVNMSDLKKKVSDLEKRIQILEIDLI